MEENDKSIEELIESMNCKKVPITVTCDGVKKKFYSLSFAVDEIINHDSQKSHFDEFPEVSFCRGALHF